MVSYLANMLHLKKRKKIIKYKNTTLIGKMKDELKNKC